MTEQVVFAAHRKVSRDIRKYLWVFIEHLEESEDKKMNVYDDGADPQHEWHYCFVLYLLFRPFMSLLMTETFTHMLSFWAQ